MAWFHPAAVEHRRQLFTRPDGARYLRHDAHRFGPPKSQEKSWAARMVDQIRAEEAEAARAAEIAAFEAEHRALRRELAELNEELAWRALCRKYGFNPDQPRNELGRWTDAGGESDTSADQAGDYSTGAEARIMSDAGSGPAADDARYAQTRAVVDASALTGHHDIDTATRALANRLAAVIDTVGPGSGPLYGIMVHEALKVSLRADPIPGIQVGDIEPSYGGPYGSKGSIRPDVVFRSELEVRPFAIGRPARPPSTTIERQSSGPRLAWTAQSRLFRRALRRGLQSKHIVPQRQFALSCDEGLHRCRSTLMSFLMNR